MAAHDGHLGILRLLLAKKVNLGKTDHRGGSPAHLAAAAGHLPVLQFLLLNLEFSPDYDGNYPAHVAASSGHTAALSLFLSEGQELESTCKLGRTPAHVAASVGHLAVLAFLQEKVGVSQNSGPLIQLVSLHPLNHQQNRGSTMLRNPQVSFSKDKQGWTVAHYAASEGHAQVLQLLDERKVRLPMKKLRQLAEARGHASVLTWLQGRKRSLPCASADRCPPFDFRRKAATSRGSYA